jgi:hypothetical protein
MLAVRGHYDGKVVVLDAPVPARPEAEVLVIFRDHQIPSAAEARVIRQQLRDSAKGVRLVEKLLADRKQDG